MILSYRYLITTEGKHPPFIAPRFNIKSDFNILLGMTVYDLYLQKYTTDGITWEDITEQN